MFASDLGDLRWLTASHHAYIVLLVFSSLGWETPKSVWLAVDPIKQVILFRTTAVACLCDIPVGVTHRTDTEEFCLCSVSRCSLERKEMINLSIV